MIKLTNHLGVTTISSEYLANLIGKVTTDCYGVVAMATTDMGQSLRGFISEKNYLDKGVKVRFVNEKLYVDLHIVVMYGMNISAIVKSIMGKVRYTVKENTGFDVAKINVFVDGMTN